MYSEIVNKYMNVEVNSFYSRVDTATTDVANMSDIARFHARLDPLCVTGDIADAKRRIYDGIVVDGYEFGLGMVSQINSSIFRPWALCGKYLAQNKKLSPS